MKNWIKNILRKEPAQLVGAVTSVLVGTGTLLTNLALDLPPDATWAQIGLTAAAYLLPLIHARITRRLVYSPESFDNKA